MSIDYGAVEAQVDCSLAATLPPHLQHWPAPHTLDNGVRVNEFFPEYHEALAARGYRLIAEDRPQYGPGFRLARIDDRS